MSSTSPALSASFAGIGSPDRIIGSAFSMPTRRGSRCVPPAPGMSPSLISGRPSRVPAAATRKWQPMVSSSPPPSGVPCTAAMVGFLMSSISEITSIRPGGCEGLPNSVMSAPATNVRPAPVTHDRFHARVVARLLEAFHQARPHAMAQRIHGRIVDGDNGDVAVAPHADWIVHERLSLKFSYL